jgi:DNA-binding NarL/FixJ family response regulator
MAAANCARGRTETVSISELGPGRPKEDKARLSDREWDVLDLLASGMTNRAAARRLGISERTVREHIARIFLKLRVNSRVEAAVIATEWRLAQNSPRQPISA